MFEFLKRKKQVNIQFELQKFMTDLLKDPNSPLQHTYTHTIFDNKGKILKTEKETNNVFWWTVTLLLEVNVALREIKELLKK